MDPKWYITDLVDLQIKASLKAFGYWDLFRSYHEGTALGAHTGPSWEKFLHSVEDPKTGPLKRTSEGGVATKVVGSFGEKALMCMKTEDEVKAAVKICIKTAVKETELGTTRVISLIPLQYYDEEKIKVRLEDIIEETVKRGLSKDNDGKDHDPSISSDQKVEDQDSTVLHQNKKVTTTVGCSSTLAVGATTSAVIFRGSTINNTTTTTTTTTNDEVLRNDDKIGEKFRPAMSCNSEEKKRDLEPEPRPVSPGSTSVRTHEQSKAAEIKSFKRGTETAFPVFKRPKFDENVAEYVRQQQALKLKLPKANVGVKRQIPRRKKRFLSDDFLKSFKPCPFCNTLRSIYNNQLMAHMILCPRNPVNR